MISAHINHVRRVAGVDHIGLGSDYCGTTRYNAQVYLLKEANLELAKSNIGDA